MSVTLSDVDAVSIIFILFISAAKIVQIE